VQKIVGGGPFNWTVGHATDHTDMMRAFLLTYYDRDKSLMEGIEEGDFEVMRVTAYYSTDWLMGESPAKKRKWPMDIGGATSTGLTRYKKSRNLTGT
jgi:hypothetical protein